MFQKIIFKNYKSLLLDLVCWPTFSRFFIKIFFNKGFDIDKSKIDNLNKYIDINKQFSKSELRKKIFFSQIFTILKIQIYL